MTTNTAGNSIIIIGAIFLPLNVIAVALRIWARRLRKTSLKLCDYLIIVALALNFANAGIGFDLAVNGAVGLPMKEASLDEIETALKLFVAAPILWGINTCVIKLSVLTFYHDIFDIPAFKKACYAVMGLSAALLIAVILGTCLLCHPFSYAWDKSIPGGYCGDATKNYLAIGIVNMVVDFSILFLPMPILWNLQMPIKKKVAIIGILSLGLIVSIFSVLRIPAILNISDTDFTGTVLLDVIWGALEILLGVITACLPLLQPPLAHTFSEDSAIRSLFRGTLSSFRSGRNSEGHSMPKESNGSSIQITDYSNERSTGSFRRIHGDSLELDNV